MGCNCKGNHHDHHQDHDGCQCHDDHHHDNHHHEEMKTIYLTLEDGSELKCEVVVELEVDGKEYIGLLPEGGERVFLYKYEETDEGPELSIIEDDNEFNKVAEVYEDMIDSNIM
ncbi:MAG: DUF1292 domain-containing protein [Tissierellaceae bacterium]|nr:DUF1292 domain-containing protein [Tissierellaceae bacterium]